MPDPFLAHDLKNLIALEFDIPVEKLLKKNHYHRGTRNARYARKAYAFLLRYELGMTFGSIAKRLDLKDHNSARYLANEGKKLWLKNHNWTVKVFRILSALPQKQ